MATYLYRTESAGSRKTFTWSAWVKRSKLGSSQMLAACSYASSDETYFFFNGSDNLIWQSSSASYGDIRTNRKFRDTNAYYHIVLAFDTTQATASNRIRIYVNGVEETSFSTATYPSQDTQVYWNVGGTYYPRIGRRHASGDEFYGCMSHIVHIDGTQELPTIFGETDSTTGEWKIKTSITPSSGWGTNGYWILKDGNSLTDQSGQGNNWTLGGGTLTNTEDCPSNIFCTLNPQGLEQWTLSNGNLSISGASDNQMVVGTMHSDAGYYEVKIAGTSHGSGGKGARIGLCKVDGSHAITYSGISGSSGDLEKFIGVQTSNGNYKAIYNNGNEVTNYSSDSWSQNDILQVAWKNNKIWYGVNGTWLGSGNPSSGTNEADTLTSGSMYIPAIISSLAGADDCHFNFGNGYFGTTAISSEGTNASSIGKFEFDVPTGCTAVSTKGLNE